MKLNLTVHPNIISIVKFSLSSFSSFLIDYALFSALVLVMPDTATAILLANIAARIVSSTYNYFVNCRLVFNKHSKFKSASQYFMLAVFIIMVNSLVIEFLTQILPLSAYIAKLITECVMFFVSWFVQKKFIFKKGGE